MAESTVDNKNRSINAKTAALFLITSKNAFRTAKEYIMFMDIKIITDIWWAENNYDNQENVGTKDENENLTPSGTYWQRLPTM